MSHQHASLEVSPLGNIREAVCPLCKVLVPWQLLGPEFGGFCLLELSQIVHGGSKGCTQAGNTSQHVEAATAKKDMATQGCGRS